MALYESQISSLPRLGKGKVRDIYAVGEDKMLIGRASCRERV